MRRPRALASAGSLKGLTPLVDTVFLLLFALLAVSTAKSIQRDELVRVRLPSVEPGGEAMGQAARSITLEIDAASRVSVAGSADAVSSRAELDAALAAAVGEALIPEEVHVEIRADRAARHGTAVAVLQHLRLRGFAHVDLLAVGATSADEPFAEGR
jgi:biopolymer transport protein ExbD